MRRITWIVAGAALLAGYFGGGMVARSARAQDGLPDLNETGWTGKVKAKFFPQDTSEDGGNDTLPASVSIAQEGSDLTDFDITVQDESGPQVFDCTGKIGNRVFWAFNGDASGPLLVVGTVAGNGKKFKGAGIYADPTGGVNEFKVNAKLLVP